MAENKTAKRARKASPKTMKALGRTKTGNRVTKPAKQQASPANPTKKKRQASQPEGPLVSVAAQTGRTLGRAARGVDRVAATVKKTTASVLGRGQAKRTKESKDPVAELERARTRALWKRQADDANATELARHGAMVDERARVRAVTGMSWSNRKPR